MFVFVFVFWRWKTPGYRGSRPSVSVVSHLRFTAIVFHSKVAANLPRIKSSNSEWIGVLARCIITFVPQIFYDIGNLTTVLEKWRFHGHLTARCLSRRGKGLFSCEENLAGELLLVLKGFEEVWRGKTWHVFVGLKFNVATPMVQRKIKTWLFGILICFGPFVIQNCKSFFFVQIDSGKQLTTLLVMGRRMPICQNIVRGRRD